MTDQPRQPPAQPTAPYLEAVTAYGFRGSLRFHVPGHKGGEGVDPGLLAAIGERALLLDVPRTASVTAVEPTTLLALEAHDFRDVLAGYLGRASELERLSHLRLLSHKRLDEVV